MSFTPQDTVFHLPEILRLIICFLPPLPTFPFLNLRLINKETNLALVSNEVWLPLRCYNVRSNNNTHHLNAAAFFSPSALQPLSVKRLRSLGADRSIHRPNYRAQITQCIEKGEMRNLVLSQFSSLFVLHYIQQCINASPLFHSLFKNASWAGFDELYFASFVADRVDILNRSFISEEELTASRGWECFFKKRTNQYNEYIHEEESDEDVEPRFRRDLQVFNTNHFHPFDPATKRREYKIENEEHNMNHPGGLDWKWSGLGEIYYQKDVDDADTQNGYYPGGRVYCKRVNYLEDYTKDQPNCFNGQPIPGIKRYMVCGNEITIGPYPPLVFRRNRGKYRGRWSQSNIHVRMFLM
jgi:hypothetical protein